MAKKTRTAQQEKEIQMLLANNEMYEKTKEEVRLRGGDEDKMKLIVEAQKDIIQKLRNVDESVADEVVSKNSSNKDNGNDVVDFLSRDESSVYDRINLVGANNVISTEEVKVGEDALEARDTSDDVYGYYNGSSSTVPSDFGAVNSDVQYDIVSLPSNGQCYKDKRDRIAVAYLTAYDENMITSPNLYKDGLVIDCLLKQKIVDKSIDIDSLCVGDVDAITLFLRASSYGADFPIVVKDPQSGEQIESVVDLSQLKVKEFKLEGDENGYFDFKLPVSGDDVKFKFLTRRDEKLLMALSRLEEEGVKANTVRGQIKDLTDAIKSDKILSGKEKQMFVDDLGKMSDWVKKLASRSPLPYSKTITNRLELSIVSVNGNGDKKFISQYVRNMGAKDSLMLRRYILENEPGIDFSITVERPLSLGGGSFDTFLEWDDSIFLNIA
jgi:hypothetical protein